MCVYSLSYYNKQFHVVVESNEETQEITVNDVLTFAENCLAPELD